MPISLTDALSELRALNQSVASSVGRTDVLVFGDDDPPYFQLSNAAYLVDALAAEDAPRIREHLNTLLFALERFFLDGDSQLVNEMRAGFLESMKSPAERPTVATGKIAALLPERLRTEYLKEMEQYPS
jgi:hypothetical protein